MGQEQPRMGGSGKLTEKEKPEEKDRANATFRRRFDNNPAVKQEGTKHISGNPGRPV